MSAERRVRGVVVVLAGVAVLVAGCSTGTAGAGGPDAAVTATAGVVGTTAPSGSAPSGADRAAVPESLLLPDEGGRSTDPDVTDWTTDNTIGQAWLLDPCRPTAYPTDRQRVRFRTVSRQGPEAQDARQLGVYPTAEVAAEVLAGFRRALEACRTGRSGGTQWTWVTEDAAGLGDDGFVAASTQGGPEYAGHGARIAVTRAGSAVFLACAGGEFYTAELDGGADAMREVAQRFLDSL